MYIFSVVKNQMWVNLQKYYIFSFKEECLKKNNVEARDASHLVLSKQLGLNDVRP